ncbi:MAG TPA: hypothetical protein GXX64_06715 [Bacteroidales bacterium]|jgi:hypothetical protein|nr:hypothetical protein [Bacteroidales bacterium]
MEISENEKAVIWGAFFFTCMGARAFAKIYASHGLIGLFGAFLLAFCIVYIIIISLGAFFGLLGILLGNLLRKIRG